MANKKNTHGGNRKGSGRHLKYGKKTKTVSFRVPISLHTRIKKELESVVNELVLTYSK